MHIGFLGLGNMGLPMVRNLLGLGHVVMVYNRTPGRAKALVARGAKEAPTVAKAVKNADIAITMLADDAAVKEVVYGAEGLLQHLPAGAVHLCMSTISVETSSALATAHAKAKQGYVAAPVFGKASGAGSRHLWIVAGGPEPQVKRCLPLFEALARGHMRVGPKAALAHAIKLGGKVIASAMENAVLEILTYAEKTGMAPADYLRLLNTTIFRFHMVDSSGKGQVRSSLDPEDMALDLAANEMLLQTADNLEIDIPAADLLKSRIQTAANHGWSDGDIALLSETFLSEAGLDPAEIPADEEAPSVPLVQDAAAPVLEDPGAPKEPGENALLQEVGPQAQAHSPAEDTSSPSVEDPLTPSVAAPPSLAEAIPQVIEAIPQVIEASAHPTEPKAQPFENAGQPDEDASQSAEAPPQTVIENDPQLSLEAIEHSSVQATLRLTVEAIRQLSAQAAQQHPRGELTHLPDTSSPVAPSNQPINLTIDGPGSTFPARHGDHPVRLELGTTTHFELVQGHVWAWSHEKRYGTAWRTLAEVELAFSQVLFLRIRRNLLLRPEAVLDFQPKFGGGAKIRLGEHLELDLNRATAARLKELLGL